MSDSLSLAFFLKIIVRNLNDKNIQLCKRYNWGYNRQYLPRH